MNRALEALKLNVKIFSDLIAMYERSEAGALAKISAIEAKPLPESYEERIMRSAELAVLREYAADDRGALRAYKHALGIMHGQIKEVENEENSSLDQVRREHFEGRN